MNEKKYKVSFVRIVTAENETEAIEQAIADSSFPDTQDIYDNFCVIEMEENKWWKR